MYLGYDGVINVSCKFFPRLSRSFVGWIGPRSGTFGHPFYHPEDLSWCYDVIMKPVMKAFVGHWYQDISKIFKDHWELPPYYHRHDWLALLPCRHATCRGCLSSRRGDSWPFGTGDSVPPDQAKRGRSQSKMIYHLVMTNTSPWYRWPIEIDGLPTKNGWIFRVWEDWTAESLGVEIPVAHGATLLGTLRWDALAAVAAPRWGWCSHRWLSTKTSPQNAKSQPVVLQAKCI